MGGPVTAPSRAALHRLQTALDARASAKSRAFWRNYLKGNATFRGVPMAAVRTATHAWWQAEGFEALPAAAQKKVALRLFEEEPSEDKLAGTLLLAETLLTKLSRRDLPSFARLFARGHIADWNTCDWFCVKVLGPMVLATATPAATAAAIGGWRRAKPLWQRRAACVAFVNLARHGSRDVPGLPEVVLESSTALVADPERFAQTGVGWVLRELSLHDRARVVRFAEEQAARLSREAMKSLAEKMPTSERKRLLALHRDVQRAARGAPATATPSARLARTLNPMPPQVAAALQRRNLLTAFQSRPSYQQNDYLGWIARAKRPATQEKRLAQMLDELEAGDRYMKMAWRPRG